MDSYYRKVKIGGKNYAPVVPRSRKGLAHARKCQATNMSRDSRPTTTSGRWQITQILYREDMTSLQYYRKGRGLKPTAAQWAQGQPGRFTRPLTKPPAPLLVPLCVLSFVSGEKDPYKHHGRSFGL